MITAWSGEVRSGRYPVRLLSYLVFAAILATCGGCATVPFDRPRQPSNAITDTAETSIGKDVSAWVDAHDGRSGFYPLISGTDAFGARLTLIERAESSIDAQYFLMKDDDAGHIFAGALLQAASRGVRIRLLLDDVFTTANDEGLAVLAAHPNIDVRLYNPIARRGVFHLNFLADFKRANRRMHNKSFTVDNRVTIIGGRNIANEYFQLRTSGEFLDFDMLAMGPAASAVADTFDTFWNDSRSVPLAFVADRLDPSDVEAARSRITAGFESAQRSIYAEAMQSPLISDLWDGRVQLYPAAFEIVTDNPEKLVSEIDEQQQVLVNYLSVVVEEAKSEIILITPYFVPLEAGVAFWRDVVARGVQVVVVTNSLASNNHTAVHSGYSKYRRQLIDAGVELYEVRADAGSGRSAGGAIESGQVTLHTKVAIIDRERFFVGSLNLDPRSIEINTELGAVIQSPDLARAMTGLALEFVDKSTYRVERREDGKLRWRATIDGKEVIERKEPLAGGWLRFKARLLKVVPDSQL